MGVDASEQREPARQLSREVIVTAALRIVDDEGLDALSMRRLGAELGAGATSIYWWVKSKDDLLGLLLEAVVAEVELPFELQVAEPLEQARAMTLQFYRVLKAHPNTLAVLATRRPLGPNSLRVVDAAIGILRTAGFDDEEALDAFSLLENYALAFALAEVAAGPDDDGSELDQLGQFVRHGAPGLSPEDFPNLVAVARYEPKQDERRRFEFGLDRILDGLRVELDRQSPTA